MLAVIFYIISIAGIFITLVLGIAGFGLLFEGREIFAGLGAIAVAIGGLSYTLWLFGRLLTTPTDFLKDDVSKKPLSSQEKNFLENFLLVQKNLLQLYDEILQDQKINNYIEESPDVKDSKIFIYHCLIYDIAVLTQKLYGDQILQKPKPAFAVFVLENTLLRYTQNNPMKNFLQENDIEELETLYKKTMQKHLQRKFYEVVASLTDVANEENPVHLESPSNGFLFSEKNFSLNPLLHLIESPLSESYANALYRFALFLSKSDDYMDKQEETVLQEIHKLLYDPFSLGNIESAQIANHKEKSESNELVQNKEKVLQETMEELNQLIGLQKVKEEINTLINFIKIQKERESSGLKTTQISYHIVFTGNPGFRSRFNRYINFPDSTPQELLDIFRLQCKKAQYVLTDSAQKKLTNIFEKAYQTRDRSFGNGRLARNLFEKAVENQANRIAKLRQINKDILMTLQQEDIEG